MCLFVAIDGGGQVVLGLEKKLLAGPSYWLDGTQTFPPLSPLTKCGALGLQKNPNRDTLLLGLGFYTATFCKLLFSCA